MTKQPYPFVDGVPPHDMRQHSVTLHLTSAKTMTKQDPPETGSVEKEGQSNKLDREPGHGKLGAWAV
jgi:hypothetical protein